MTARKAITQAYLRSILDYDPETGIWRWKVRRGNRSPGQVAGKSVRRYIQIRIDKRCFYAHRLAFVYMLGREPVGDIDHANRNRSDCRWANLREATRSQNCANTPLRRDNTSGHRGIRFVREVIVKEGWRVVIHHQGKNHHVGYFKTKEDAIAAWRKKAKELFGAFAMLD